MARTHRLGATLGAALLTALAGASAAPAQAAASPFAQIVDLPAGTSARLSHGAVYLSTPGDCAAPATCPTVALGSLPYAVGDTTIALPPVAPLPSGETFVASGRRWLDAGSNGAAEVHDAAATTTQTPDAVKDVNLTLGGTLVTSMTEGGGTAHVNVQRVDSPGLLHSYPPPGMILGRFGSLGLLGLVTAEGAGLVVKSAIVDLETFTGAAPAWQVVDMPAAWGAAIPSSDEVSMWGQVAVMTDPVSRTVTLLRPPDRTQQLHWTPPTGERPWRVVASEDAVLVATDAEAGDVAGLYLWRAGAPAPESICPTTVCADPSMSGPYVSWRDDAGVSHIGTLSEGPTEDPRVLGVLAPSLVTPAGTAATATWRPEIDLSENLASWSMTIQRGTTTVRTLTGGPTHHGALREVTWDGRTSTGALAPNGTYTWTLSGTGLDGGPLKSRDGTAPASGTIHVASSAPAASMTNALYSSSVSATTRAPVTWTSPAAVPGTTLVHDVETRLVSVSSTGARSYGTPTRVVTGTTARSSSLLGARGRTYQLRVRTRDDVGHTGAWSAWRTMIFPYDDLQMTLTGGSRGTSASRYLGTLTTLDGARSSAVLVRTALPTNRIAVVADRSATSGSVRILVDGVYKATVSLTSSTTRTRQVVWSSAVAYGRHSVTLDPVATSSTRRYARIDALALGL